MIQKQLGYRSYVIYWDMDAVQFLVLYLSRNILINLVIMLLIITGGIGFLTWDDIYTNKINYFQLIYIIT